MRCTHDEEQPSCRARASRIVWKEQHRLPIKQRVIANARAAGLGSTIPWFIAQQSWNTGTTSVAVTAAQAAIANHSISIWTGRNADSITTGQAYGTHLADAGADMYAGQWQTAGRVWSPALNLPLAIPPCPIFLALSHRPRLP
jgi:hypothetical protein